MAQEVIDRIPSFRLRVLHSTAASLFISGDGTVSNAGGRRTQGRQTGQTQCMVRAAATERNLNMRICDLEVCLCPFDDDEVGSIKPSPQLFCCLKGAATALWARLPSKLH